MRYPESRRAPYSAFRIRTSVRGSPPQLCSRPARTCRKPTSSARCVPDWRAIKFPSAYFSSTNCPGIPWARCRKMSCAQRTPRCTYRSDGGDNHGRARWTGRGGERAAHQHTGAGILGCLPEQYPTSIRATAFAFVTSFGRFVGAGVNFLIGAGVHSYGSIGMPVAATSVAFVLGVFLLPLCLETRGEPLP